MSFKSSDHTDHASVIRKIRESLCLGRTEFANLLGMGSSGERTIRGWENGEHKPSKLKFEAVLNLNDYIDDIQKNAPFYQPKDAQYKFKFIDLFAGIGGIRLPFQELGGQCVFTSEWDKFAQKTYLANFGEMPSGDITQIPNSQIPSHDILLGGFPCQAFSQAGLKKGFSDTRGTLFFEIQRILAEHQPKAFLLENVKQLKGHDKGKTLKTILDILTGRNDIELPNDLDISDESKKALSKKLNYHVEYKVLRAADFGVPQNRERIFIVGFNKDYFEKQNIEKFFSWPIPSKKKTKVGDILEKEKDLALKPDVYTISDKLWAGHQKRKAEHKTKGNGFGYSLFNAESEYTNTISARYYKDGSEVLIDQSEKGLNPRKLTPKECAKLQGFPDKYKVDAVSHGQIYKQFGNSVCMTVIEAIAHSMVVALDKLDEKS